MSPVVGALRVPREGRPPILARGRRDTAVRWRWDNRNHPDRDRMWRAFRTGALWNGRLDPALHARLTAILAEAEAAVPFWPASPAP